MLRLGSVHLKWRRDSRTADDSVFTEHKLPDIRVELPPLTVSLECPPYAILGDPFTYYIKITNQTHLLQEVKFSLSDSQSFVMSGPHSSSVAVLPKADHILAYKLVPLASGSLQLPKVTLTSVRYSAVFQSSADASSIFAYPSKPCFKIVDEGDNKAETVEAT
ncbi:hypothetical protein MLD38_004766 [Melastoma candidum]|nr:hypothetical protein MLD38_004766 [Melastoma candidum]